MLSSLHREKENPMNKVSTQDTRAVARYNVAQAIVAANNSYEILNSLADLASEYEAMLDRRLEQENESGALRWARVLQEISTIAACAVINLEESGK
jgi:hypothetical protein